LNGARPARRLKTRLPPKVRDVRINDLRGFAGSLEQPLRVSGRDPGNTAVGAAVGDHLA